MHAAGTGHHGHRGGAEGRAREGCHQWQSRRDAEPVDHHADDADEADLMISALRTVHIVVVAEHLETEGEGGMGRGSLLPTNDVPKPSCTQCSEHPLLWFIAFENTIAPVVLIMSL